MASGLSEESGSSFLLEVVGYRKKKHFYRKIEDGGQSVRRLFQLSGHSWVTVTRVQPELGKNSVFKRTSRIKVEGFPKVTHL